MTFNIREKIKNAALIRQTERELNTLTNRELADIGINRYDIGAIARSTVYK